MTWTQRAFLVLVAIGATISALFLAERLGGPLARAVLGPPAGFQTDVTTPAAYGQAFLVQGVFLGLAFLLLGTIAGWRFRAFGYKYALWVANPITLGVGCAAYKWTYHSLHLSDYLAEYDSPKTFALSCIAFPLVALCFYAGAHLRRSHHVRT
jgi:hypothetical protein